MAAVFILPLFGMYVTLQQETGFDRSLEDARPYSATWRAYLTSGAYASSWLQNTTNFQEVLFPGFIAVVCGIAGFAVAFRSGGRPRRIAVLYGSLAVLAFWESLGPRGGLYTLTYITTPAFSFMRAPFRFGVVVSFAFAVLASIALAALFRRSARPAVAVATLVLVGVAEHVSPFRFTPVPRIDPVYEVLASQPYGALIELPLYSRPHGFSRTRYMLNSTAHWMPLVNAYSDHTPAQFSENVAALADLPTREAFRRLPEGVRYVTFHLHGYPEARRDELVERLNAFDCCLSPLQLGERIWLYEIVRYPELVP